MVFFFLDIFSGLGSSFFGTAIYFNINNYNLVDIEFLSTIIKVSPLLITILGSTFSLFLYNINTFLFFSIKKNKIFKYFYTFLLKKWYTDRVVNEIFTLFILKCSLVYIYTRVDRGFLEVFGPSTVSRLVTL